jgi:hypothetical protein
LLCGGTQGLVLQVTLEFYLRQCRIAGAAVRSAKPSEKESTSHIPTFAVELARHRPLLHPFHIA